MPLPEQMLSFRIQIVRSKALGGVSDTIYLELELTESVIMENGDMAITKLNRLKALGLKISIVDSVFLTYKNV